MTYGKIVYKMWQPSKMILTAGPKIGKNDIRYVSDAVKNGWNLHHSDYIYKFEEAFAKYVNAKYTLSMPHGTSALHIALVCMGVGRGDEVIVPDLTYVTCANVVHQLGAIPILVDIDRETWSIDTSRLEKYITKKTKVIMPVHLYGNIADMDGIAQIAKKHHLHILEDACEGLGSTLHGKQVGSLSDAAAFSFQGAKLLSIGEGGMLVTKHKGWIERARSIVDNGISFTRQFWHNEIGYMYAMSNIQAALGLSRLEDIDDLIARKRRINRWYRERLGGIKGIQFSPERKGVVSSFWMNTIVLDTDFGITRDELRIKMSEMKIDTRPFFFPISEFCFYNKQPINNPVSYHVSHNGINLPSGVMLTERMVDYIASVIRKLLLK
ncbi:MAG: DegT/DnrJ/EryC1/StrS aminotransferase [Microgenomates group bacterium GW2011_GWA2_47_8]|nr:MAG: DegT/DnrJ/EryC1/StrS aminotransferase [Microgenomates group bacterium GW2011_GWA2_47_8]